jgi:hypothetical protein
MTLMRLSSRKGLHMLLRPARAALATLMLSPPFALASPLVAALALASASPQARADDDAHRNWAYPDGVIVSNSGNTSAANHHKKTLVELDRLTDQVEQALVDCAKQRRKLNPELQTTGEKVLFTLTFDIHLDGSVGDAEVRKSLGSAPIPDCGRRVVKLAETYRFSPLDVDVKHRQSLGAHIPFQMLILTDAEAQGRGFQYLAAEETWEHTIDKNQHWFRCRISDDCIITYEMCEVRAVNKTYEKDYLDAVAKRQREGCREPDRPQVLSPACKAGRCATVDAAGTKSR